MINHVPSILRRVSRRFGRSRSGQIAIMFGLMSIPVLFATGAAIDYGRRNATKAQLDAALDGVVLSVISQKTNSISDASLTSMEDQFRAEAQKIPGVTITSFPKPTVTVTSDTLNLAASYTAAVKTSLGSLMRVDALNIGGSSSSTRNVLQYINFHLLLDNSPSMGLAATDTDVANMKRVTPDGCAFGCHEHTYDSKGNVTGDKLNDYYHIAVQNNIKLRIHVLRDAVSALVDQANASMQLPQQFQMEMWTFSDQWTQTKLQSMTSTLGAIKSATQKIDLAYAYRTREDTQTDFERAFARMNTEIPAGGNGLTSATPIRFLFFVTDGVQDTLGSVTNNNQNGSAGTYFYSRFVGPINPAICSALKKKNVRIGIIYTEYLPIYTDWFYNGQVKPYEKKIGSLLQSCASDDLFFTVETGGDITKAMLKLFSAAVASVRLTN